MQVFHFYLLKIAWGKSCVCSGEGGGEVSSASAIALLPFLLCIHQAFNTHTLSHTDTHESCAQHKEATPRTVETPTALGHTTPLACRALKSINSFWSCTNTVSLKLASFPSPSLSLCCLVYLLLFSMRLFSLFFYSLPPSYVPYLSR